MLNIGYYHTPSRQPSIMNDMSHLLKWKSISNKFTNWLIFEARDHHGPKFILQSLYTSRKIPI